MLPQTYEPQPAHTPLYQLHALAMEAGKRNVSPATEFGVNSDGENTAPAVTLSTAERAG
ncbi:MAG: hypothetical protein IJA63_03490 [Akkermansia sp.]|nr:hypothetical protein [Akkermansia sp.]